MSSHKPILAIFDFDGTITTRDTLISFLFYTMNKRAVYKKLAGISPQLLSYVLNRMSRQAIKETILSTFFRGMPLAHLKELGGFFSHSSNLKRLIRPEALKRIEWHRNQNHRCVLISAGINIYLEPWGKLMGFDQVICSRLEMTSDGLATGCLQGLNCWGPEKLRRLEECYGAHQNYILYAYGDSRGDRDLLEAADYPFYRKLE